MPTLMIVLRLLHILAGVFWAGAMLFLAHFLGPALGDAGPAGGAVMMALVKRKMLTIIPLAAIVTILAGFWMFWIDSEGMQGPWLHSHQARTLSIGALLALIALVIGLAIVRPTQLKILGMMREIGPLPEGPDKQLRLATVAPLRAKAMAAGKAVAGLLSLAVIAMAIARYV